MSSTEDTAADQAIKTIFFAIASTMNLVALAFFLYRHIKSEKKARAVLVIQILGHFVGFLYPLAKIILVYSFSVPVQLLANIFELSLMVSESFYFFEIFKAFGTVQRVLSPRGIYVCQVSSPLIMFLLAGSVLFKEISFKRSTDPGFIAKWSVLFQVVYIVLPFLGLFVAWVAFKTFRFLMDGLRNDEKNDIAMEKLRRTRQVLIVFVCMIVALLSTNVMNSVIWYFKSGNISVVNALSNSILAGQFATFALLLYYCSSGIMDTSIAKRSTLSTTK